jgi:hypothetical protein
VYCGIRDQRLLLPSSSAIYAFSFLPPPRSAASVTFSLRDLRFQLPSASAISGFPAGCHFRDPTVLRGKP